MARVLEPFEHFRTPAFSLDLKHLVGENERMLRSRQFWDVLDHYGPAVSEYLAESNVLDGIRNFQQRSGPFSYAVVDEHGDLRGTAAVYPDNQRPLGKLPPLLPLRPLQGIGSRRWEVVYNVSAWVSGDPDSDTTVELLSGVYTELVRHAGTLVLSPIERVWAAEPVRSPRGIHEAIAASGVHRVAEGRYIQGGGHGLFVPWSVLYEDKPRI